MPLGEILLEAGVHELAVTAHGNAGEDGIACHPGLDVLRLRLIVPGRGWQGSQPRSRIVDGGDHRCGENPSNPLW
jgi:hypothetical protein